ncbi:hypothetical protein [Neotabrizicola sp. sgz301269]|uniref:hypothetical protein n=1 Tax=Neotabrizicola sp. sgz301269 TaxID=3276282 RepID=UPI00377060F8
MAGEDQWWLADPIAETTGPQPAPAAPQAGAATGWWQADPVVTPPAQSAAMTEGLAKLSDLTTNPPPPEAGWLDQIRPTATFLMDRMVPGMGTYTEAALGPAPQPGQQTVGEAIYGNVVGNPDDGITNTGEALRTWLRRAGETMTLGVIGDEAHAILSSKLTGRDYDAELARLRKEEEGMSGVGRLSADLVGGALPAFTGVGIAAKAPSLMKAAARGVGLGAGAGAVQGFMEGEGDLSRRALAAAMSAGVGGSMGGVIPFAGHVAGKVGRAGAEWLGNRRLAYSASDALGISPQTARGLSDTLGVDDPAAIRAYLDQAGPDAMLADASPAAAGALDAAMQSPGRAARIAHDRVTGRASESARRLEDALDGAMGPAQGARALSDDIRIGSAPARAAAYDAAYAAPIDYSGDAGRQIEDLLRRVPDAAIRRANELMALEGNQSAQILAEVGKDGTVSFFRLPDVRQLDYITRALGDVAAAADGQGKLGGTTAMGRAVGNLSRELRGALRTAVPEYGAALDVASDAISERNALDLGQKIFSPRTTREEVFDALQGASKAEVDAMKRGARSFIDEKLANVRAVISDHSIEPRQAMEALRQLGSPASQAKLAALLGDAWPGLRAELSKASRALALRARTSGNSATFARNTANDALKDAIEPNLLRQVKPLAWAKESLATAMGASRRAVNRMTADSKAELADLLTQPGAAQAIMDAMEGARGKFAVGPEAAKLPNFAMQSLLAAMAPTGAASAGQGVANWLQGR